MPKYKKQTTGKNSNPRYKDMFDKRGVPFIKQTRTMPFTGLDFDTILVTDYVWKQKDSLHKLSQLFYNTFEYWWVIGLINKKPTDAHYSIGDIIQIPSNPELITDSIGG